jgi:hypothetical protein
MSIFDGGCFPKSRMGSAWETKIMTGSEGPPPWRRATIGADDAKRLAGLKLEQLFFDQSVVTNEFLTTQIWRKVESDGRRVYVFSPKAATKAAFVLAGLVELTDMVVKDVTELHRDGFSRTAPRLSG